MSNPTKDELLTGLELDRAIATARGWTGFKNDIHANLVGLMPTSLGKLVLVPRWSTDPALALALLEEMLRGKTIRMQAGMGLDEEPLYIFYRRIMHSEQFYEELLLLEHHNFCIAIGNAYLRWKEGEI